MTKDIGRSVPDGLSQQAAEPEEVSALRASIPSADDVRAVVGLLQPEDFQPFVKRAADEFYECLMVSCEDHLRDNVEWNIGSHISMLERENQRMRTELYEVDRALGCMSLGHETRIKSVEELQERHNRAVNEMWRLRSELASGTSGSAQDAQRLDPKGAGPTAEGGDAQGLSA